MADPGFQTPEDAVLADFDAPRRYITILGSEVRGDRAMVWMLTNDRPPFEEYTEVCFREDGGWTVAFGSSLGSFTTAPNQSRS